MPRDEFLVPTRRATPYLYMVPLIGFTGLIFLYPLVSVAITSLSVPTANGAQIVGLDNFRNVLADPLFWSSFGNNLLLMLSVPILVILSVAIALLLYEQIPGWKLYRALIFLPFVVAVPVVGITFAKLYAYHGPVNALLSMIWPGAPVDWLGNPTTALPAVATVIVWREMGFAVVVVFARLMSLDRTILEAARIDGASTARAHWYVTLPQLRSTLAFVIVIELTTMLSWVFGYIYTMTGGGPASATSVVEYYIFQRAFTYHALPIASALAVMLLLAAGILIALQLRVRLRDDEG